MIEKYMHIVLKCNFLSKYNDSSFKIELFHFIANQIKKPNTWRNFSPQIHKKNIPNMLLLFNIYFSLHIKKFLRSLNRELCSVQFSSCSSNFIDTEKENNNIKCKSTALAL